MEETKKQLLAEILKKQFETSQNFRTDTNLKNELLIEEVQKYLDEKGLYDFINTDSKEFEIKVYFIQERQYQNVVLKENGKEKFIFNLSKDELIEIIIN